MRTFSEIWRERFGSEAPVELPDLAGALDRRSVRNFSSSPVDVAAIEALIGIALAGSTTCGLQTWSVISVEDADLRAVIWDSSARQDHVKSAPWFLIFCADLHRTSTVVPDAAALDLTEFLLLATMDATIAAERLVSAAERIGLGVCYVGAFRNHVQTVAEALKLPDQVVPLFGVCLGVPSKNGILRPRLRPQDVWFRDTYSSQSLDPEDYDQRMRPYFAQMNRKSDDTWSQRVQLRLDEHHREGREGLREWLQSRGLLRR